VERLALTLGICIVTTVHLPVTGEGGLRRLSVDGIVLPGSARDVLL